MAELKYHALVVEALDEALGRRERKKLRTRLALIEAAYRLFDQHGYEQTTVAQIAEAADVSNATFFKHFPAKEELLFTGGQQLLDAGVGVISAHRPDARPLDVLAEAMRHIITTASGGARDPARPLERTRIRLLISVPALRAATLKRMVDAQRQLAAALHRAYPDQLDELTAAIMVGAVTGAMFAAAEVSLHTANTTHIPMDAALQRAIDTTTHTLQTTPT